MSSQENEDNDNYLSPMKSPTDARCGKCRSVIPKGAECVGCDYCSDWFHRSCGNVTKALLGELSKASTKTTCTLKWGCLRCTEANNTAESQDTNTAQSNVNDFAMVKDCFTQIFNKFDKLEERISSKFEVMDCNIKSYIVNVTKETEEKIAMVDHKVNNNIKAISVVTGGLEDVKRQLANLQRTNNLSSLKFSNIPYSAEKNYDISMIKGFASFYNINITHKSIEYCSRLKSKKKSDAIAPIIVRFSSKELAEEILDRYFDGDPLLLSNVTNKNLNSRIYISENLTYSNLRIYHECLRLKKNNLVLKVMTVRGNVFIAETAHSKLVKVNTLDFLRTKFPLGTASSNAGMANSSHATSANVGTANSSQATTSAISGIALQSGN